MDIPVVDMILRAGWVARSINLMLLFFSFISWAIIFNRLAVLSSIGRNNKLFKDKYDTLSSVSDIDKIDTKLMNAPLGQLGKNGSIEYKRIFEDAHTQSVKDHSFFLQSQFAMVSEHLESAFLGLVKSFDKGVFFLAMMSSIAPFLGLLGTVWGIMNAFFAIGNQGSASLPVVAPGIAEALITTIMGLAVAIPALYFYNYFNHKIERIENDMEEFKDILFVRIKRETFNKFYTDAHPAPAPRLQPQMQQFQQIPPQPPRFQ
ncbi:MAG: Tol-Pal system subunit TolQ [Fibrobacter sp.]|nr:Tol-Pal system subunit TolQ [Fibrobacter sp.]